MKKRGLSLLLAILMVVSVFSPAFPSFGIQVEAAGDALATVFTGSDFQDNSHGNQVVANFKQFVANAQAAGYEEPDAFLFGGDFTSASYNAAYSELTVPRMTEAVHDIYPYYNTQNIVNVQGNHDVLTSDFNQTGLYEFDEFLVYVINCEDYPASRGNGALTKIEATTNALIATFDKLMAEGETRPIFIATHLPMHYNSRGTTDSSTGTTSHNENYYGKILFDAINAYAVVFDVIFLFGHNHSGAYDDYIGGSVNFLAPGETIKLHDNKPGEGNYVERTLNFTYMNYGYMGYSNNGVDKTLTMSAFEICTDKINVTRFSVDGKYGATKTVERKLKTNEPSVTANGYNGGTVGSATGAIAIPSGFTDPVYTWSSTNNSVAKISANGRVAQIAYNAVGTATVTVTVTERGDSSKTATDSYEVTVTNAPRDEACTVRVATQIVNDKTLEYYETSFGKTVALIGSYEGLGSSATATWSSSNTSVATVDQYGVVTFKGTGSTFITYSVNYNGTTYSAKVKFVISTEKQIEYVYKEVANSSFSAGKQYVIATTRTNNVYGGGYANHNGQGIALTGTKTSFSGSSPSRTISVTNTYVWNTIATGTDGVFYLQNDATGLYLAAKQESSTSYGDFYTTETTPSVSAGGWKVTANGNLTNGTYHWYPRSSDYVTLTKTEQTNYVVLFERTPLDPSATIEFSGEKANGATKTVYSATNGKQIPLHGDYVNIQQRESETWTSSNTSVATIDNNGVVTFKGVQGDTTITYTVKDAVNGNTVSATLTLSAILTAEVTRTFRYVTKLEAGKKYVAATKTGEVGDAYLLSSFRDTKSSLLAERSKIQTTSNGEYFVEIEVDKNYPVWIAEDDGAGHYYLKSEKEGRYLYANGSYSSGTVSTSESVSSEKVSDYQWTYTNKDIYNQTDNTDGTGNKVYLCARSAEFIGINTPSTAEFYFYEETILSPNGIITSRYDVLDETIERTEICPRQTETLVPKAENFPDNSRVTFAWASNNNEVATIDQNGVITYTGKAGVVTVTLTTTSLEYDATGTKPVDTTTVKIFVNGGTEEVPDEPGSDQPMYYLTGSFEVGKKYIIANSNVVGDAKAISNLLHTEVNIKGVDVSINNDSKGNYITNPADSILVFEAVRSSIDGYVKLKTEDGKYLVGVKALNPRVTNIVEEGAYDESYYCFSYSGNKLEVGDGSNTDFFIDNDNNGYRCWVSSTGTAMYLYALDETTVPKPETPEAYEYHLTAGFVAGEKYILRCIRSQQGEEADDVSIAVASTNISNANRLDGVLVAPENDIIVNSNEDIVWICEPGTSSSNFRLKTVDGRYLVLTGSDNILTVTSDLSKYDEVRYLFSYSTKYNGDDTHKGLTAGGRWIRYGSNNFYDSSSCGYFELYAQRGVAGADPVEVFTEIRKQDYFGSVDITNVMQYRYNVKNGDTEQMLQYINGMQDGYTTKWSVNDTSIATINADTGLLTYKGKDGYVDVMLTVTGTDINGYAVNKTLKTTFDVSTQPYQISTEDYPDYPAEGAVRTNKVAHNVIGTQNFQYTGVSQVELAVTGVPLEQPVDVVVVLDHSDSMGPERMQSAIKNTRDFALQLFNANDKNRIAVVTFDQYRYYYDNITSQNITDSSKGTEDKIITGDGTIYNPFATADDKDALVENLNSLENNNTGGTNYDSGLNYAYRILSEAKANGGNESQVVIFMSDGAPTKFNGLKLSGTSDAGSLDEAWLMGDESNSTLAAYLADTSAYPAAANFNPNGDNWYAVAIKSAKGEAIDGIPNTFFYESCTEGLGAKIFTIGYGVRSNSNEEKTLKNIASTPANFYSATSDLSDAYDSILENILYAANNASVTDKLGDKFDLQFAKSYSVKDDNTTKTITLEETPVIEVGAYTLNNAGQRVGYTIYETITFTTDGNGNLTAASSSVLGAGIYNTATSKIVGQYVTYDLNTELFTWNIGDITRDEIVLKYYAALEGFKEGTAVPNVYETNDFATLNYTNFRGTPCQQTFNVPTIAYKNAAINYEFYLVNVNGEPVNRQGQVVPFAERVLVGNEQTKQIYLSDTGDDVYTYSLLASDVVPSGYTLYNLDAAFVIKGKSGSVTSAEIIDEGSPVTTYYRDGSTAYQGAVPAANAYYNTHVSFGVVYKTGIVPDSVVIDFGLPVKVNVLVNDLNVDQGTLTAIGTGVQAGTVLHTNGYTSRMLTGEAATLQLKSGTATIVGDKVVYTPKSTNYNAVETIYYEYKTVNNEYYYTTVTVIPATSIYFEETGFITFHDVDEFTDKNGDKHSYIWQDTAPGTDIYEDVYQAEDRPGTFTFADADANNVYGTDAAYDNCATFSLGNAKYVEVDKASIGHDPTAEFTFTGTGFDLFSVTDSTTGALVVDIYKDGEWYDGYFVNTYYGYSFDANADDGKGGKGAYVPADKGAMYQTPIFRIRDIGYGTYTVVIMTMFSTAFDINPANNGKFRVYVDSVRIFDPMGTGNDVADEAYLADGEYAPNYLELRDTLISKDENGEYKVTTHGDSSLFFDGGNIDPESVNVTTDYIKNGPKNEVYLGAGQAIAFNILASSNLNLASLQVGMKLVDGTKGNATVKVFSANDGAELYPASYDLTSATEQFYKLDAAILWDQSSINAPGEDSVYKTVYPVVIMNTSDSVVSLTSLKWGYTSNIEGGQSSFNIFGDEQTPVLAMAAMARIMSTPAPEAPIDPVAPENIIVDVPAEVEVTDGKGILTVTTQPEVIKVTVDGVDITDCEIDEDGNKRWTYEFDATEPGEKSFTIVAEDFEGNVSEEIVTETVINPAPEVDDPDDSVVDDSDDITDGVGSGILTPESFVNTLLNGIFSILMKLFSLLLGGATI